LTGEPSAIRNATIAGKTLPISAEFVSGGASGGFAAVVSGMLTSVSIELIPGSAFISADAPAAALQTATYLSAGVATGGVSVSASGAAVSAASNLLPGSVSAVRNEVAAGVTLACGLGFFAGRAEIVIPYEVSDLVRRSIFVRVEHQAAFAQVRDVETVVVLPRVDYFTRVV
jgi:hypothetical protein